MHVNSHYSKQVEVSIELRLGLPMNKKKHLEHLEARRNLFQKNDPDPDTANNLIIIFSVNIHQYAGSVLKRN
jgi:hypothetical protein